jgi:hypothetical protein
MAGLTGPSSLVPGSDPRTGPERTRRARATRLGHGGIVVPTVHRGQALGSDPGTRLEEALWQD